MGKGLEVTFFSPKKDIQMAKYMKRCSLSLIIREMLWYHFMLLEWLLSKRQAIINASKDTGKREPLCTVDGNVNKCSYCGKQYFKFKKIKIDLTYDSAVHFWVFIWRKWKDCVKEISTLSMFSAAIYQPKSINRSAWIKKM